MEELLLFLVLLIIWLVGIVIVSHSDPSFLPNFWPNFFSDAIVGILIAGLVSWLLSKSKKVEAQMDIAVSSRSEDKLILTFFVENTGKVAFRVDEVYWHIFVDGRLNLIGPMSNLVTRPAEDGYYTYSENLVRVPLFPGRRTEVLAIEADAPYPSLYNFYYYLSTAHGLFPRRMKEHEDGGFLFKTLGKLTLSLP